ncbi:MAG TPA: ABC transporter, partial [Clostridiales bacterium]|nr:ABC transporter [Clostridiales bacterium]
FAFLGPNGAGKSTTINIICTILGKSGGRVRVDGNEVGREDDAVRRSIGVVFQNSVLDHRLTVRENIQTRAAFYGISGSEFHRRMDHLADVTGIGDFLGRRYGKLSGGQRRRADIARALINTPRVLFLDEPTTGLDPQTRRKVWETVHQMQRSGQMTVFLTTHYMEEAAEADDVAVIDHGRIVARGTPARLKETYSYDTLRVMPLDNDALSGQLKQMGLHADARGDRLEVPVRDSMHALGILKDIEKSISSFEVLQGNMDQVFMRITGRSIREEEDE